MNKKELEEDINKERYISISVGKLSSQNSVKIPMKICQNAKWMEGDELMFYLDKNSGNVVIVNETLNEIAPIETQFFNQNLCQKINDDQQVIIIQSDAFNSSHPVKLISNYIKEYSGFIDSNKSSGKWCLTEDEENRLIAELEQIKPNDTKQYEVFKNFLTEYKRNCLESSLPGAYIFCYHYLEKSKDKVEEVKNILKTGQKVILWGYHSLDLNVTLNRINVLNYYYLKYTTGSPVVEEKKTSNS